MNFRPLGFYCPKCGQWISWSNHGICSYCKEKTNRRSQRTMRSAFELITIARRPTAAQRLELEPCCRKFPPVSLSTVIPLKIARHFPDRLDGADHARRIQPELMT
jgi:hypothetical protein